MNAPKRNGKMMRMPRDFHLNTSLGVSVNFKADEPTFVPYRAVNAAIERGAVFVDPTNQKVLAPEPPREFKEPPMGFEREELLFQACAKIAERNNPDDFTPGSKPKLAAVKDLAGFDADRKEINDTWHKVMQARANAA